jgi:ADP-heptose:LPS heptosyltransferase
MSTAIIPIVSEKKRILLGQLGARGDCLYATAIARQIKVDYPYCHLTWGIGSMAAPLLLGNPHVDAIWEWPMDSHADMVSSWRSFEQAAHAAKARGEFDEVFLTQIYPDHFDRYDGTIRQSIFRGYPRPITVPVEPVIFLQDDEVERVRQYAQKYELTGSEPTILFEFSSHSGQSYVNSDFVIDFVNRFSQAFPKAKLILSSNIRIESLNPCIIDGSVLTFRENAELTKYCHLMIGVSSGISWLCTSNWAKPLPMIQLLNAKSSVYASFVHDYEHRGADCNHIIEMTDCDADHLLNCVKRILNKGFSEARGEFHKQIAISFDAYFGIMAEQLGEGHFDTVIESARHVVHRYGYREEFVTALRGLLHKHIDQRLQVPASVVLAYTDNNAVQEGFSELKKGQQAANLQSQQIFRELHMERYTLDRLQMLEGRKAAWALRERVTLDTLADAEFTVFSQWGEDGIVEWLLQQFPELPQRFIEFGVENYRESNTRFLLQNRNWAGLIMDGSEANMMSLRNSDLYWRHDLTALPAFITRENINQLIRSQGFEGDIGLLSIDIDGNDYWVWEAMDCVNPAIVIAEVNPILGDMFPIAVPYRADFKRFEAHHSGIYFGASVNAMCNLAERKGYIFLGTNANGINAFFVRRELFDRLDHKISRRIAWPSRHRDARDMQGRLMFTGGLQRWHLIRHLPVVNLSNGETVTLEQLGLPYSRDWQNQS